MTRYFFRFATPQSLLLLLIVPIALWLFTRKKRLQYVYPCTQLLYDGQMTHGNIYRAILNAMRLFSLILLIIISARPQWVDEQSKLEVQGLDIMLVLDVSGSMGNQDYADDQRSRFEVAKDEACRFIEKRHNDALGVVIFGNEAISLCPLTMDKKMLLHLVKDLQLGEIDHMGTKLATSMVVAVNRLKDSKAASKIMIVLTDGQPSEGDTDPACAVAIANKFGIKIYTIGIGSEQEQVVGHPLYGWVRQAAINKPLLDAFASRTGGRSFIARNAQDMREVYDTIDQLEKTKQEMPMFVEYYEMYLPFLCLVIASLCIELFLSTFFWFSV